MIQLEAERRENEEIAAGAIMSAGVGIAGALTTALWGGFGRNNGCLLYTSPSPRD